MLPPDYACPRCKCKACYALHRRGFDWVMSLLGLRPARCLTCSKKFYARYKLSDDGKYLNASGRRSSQDGGTAYKNAA
jgi:hypothetical protein